MEVCSLATAKTKASISALVKAYLCIYESSEGNDFAAESGSHGGIGAEKQNAEQGPRPSAGTSNGENTSKPQRESKSDMTKKDTAGHRMTGMTGPREDRTAKHVYTCYKCNARVACEFADGRVLCQQCGFKFTVIAGDFVKMWCIPHQDCKEQQANKFVVARNREVDKGVCRACSKSVRVSSKERAAAWQEYAHVMCGKS